MVFDSPFDKRHIRPDQLVELENYISKGWVPNSCLRLMLENNVVDAVKVADGDNQRAVLAILAFIHNNVPSIAWGSPRVIRAWAAYRKVEQEMPDEDLTDAQKAQLQELADEVSAAKAEANAWRLGR